MDQKLRNFYLESQIKNASPGQLLIMLYDGLIQNAEQADAEMTSPETSGDAVSISSAVSRCINILTELNTCLDYSVDATLCGTLSDLYRFFTQELSEAFSQRDPKRVRNILPLIRGLRDTWVQADRKANQVQFAAA